MATQTWPVTLPVGPQSFQQQPDESGVIRTQPDNGPVKMRRRFTKIPVRGTMAFTMSIAQRNIFKNFYENQLNWGTERFNFFHPWDQVVRDFRITKPYSESANGPLAVDISIEFELF